MQNGWNYTDELHKGEPFHGSLGCIPRQRKKQWQMIGGSI
jgi:hypothetical protein